jgi:hypothetical protein
MPASTEPPKRGDGERDQQGQQGQLAGGGGAAGPGQAQVGDGAGQPGRGPPRQQPQRQGIDPQQHQGRGHGDQDGRGGEEGVGARVRTAAAQGHHRAHHQDGDGQFGDQAAP